MVIAREEIFGPVVCLLHAKDLDEALAIVKSHPLANASSIYTSSGAPRGAGAGTSTPRWSA